MVSLAGPGGAGVEEVAKALGKEPKQLAVARDRLVHMHSLLEVPERAQVRFVDAEMAEWVAERPDGTSTTAAVQKGRCLRPAGAVAGPAARPLRPQSCPDSAGGAPSGPGAPGADAAGPGGGSVSSSGLAVLLFTRPPLVLAVPLIKANS